MRGDLEMVIVADEQLKSKMMKEGSHLKQTRMKGGMGAGLIAAGTTLAGMILLLAVMMIMIKNTHAAIVSGVAGVVIGAIFIGPGYALKNKRINGYLKYYRDKSGYTEEALKGFDAEFAQGEVVIISNKNKLDQRATSEAGVFTKNWFKFPFMLSIHYSGLYHVEDIVAIWYQKEFVRVGGLELRDVLMAVDCHGKCVHCNYNKALTSEVIMEIAKRNPKVITSRHFAYDGVEYDALLQAEQVATLYKTIA